MNSLIGLLEKAGAAGPASSSLDGAASASVVKDVWQALDQLAQDPQAYKRLLEEAAAGQGAKLPDGWLDRVTAPPPPEAGEHPLLLTAPIKRPEGTVCPHHPTLAVVHIRAAAAPGPSSRRPTPGCPTAPTSPLSPPQGPGQQPLTASSSQAWLQSCNVGGFRAWRDPLNPAKEGGSPPPWLSHAGGEGDVVLHFWLEAHPEAVRLGALDAPQGFRCLLAVRALAWLQQQPVPTGSGVVGPLNLALDHMKIQVARAHGRAEEVAAADAVLHRQQVSAAAEGTSAAQLPSSLLMDLAGCGSAQQHPKQTAASPGAAAAAAAAGGPGTSGDSSAGKALVEGLPQQKPAGVRKQPLIVELGAAPEPVVSSQTKQQQQRPLIVELGAASELVHGSMPKQQQQHGENQQQQRCLGPQAPAERSAGRLLRPGFFTSSRSSHPPHRQVQKHSHCKAGMQQEARSVKPAAGGTSAPAAAAAVALTEAATCRPAAGSAERASAETDAFDLAGFFLNSLPLFEDLARTKPAGAGAASTGEGHTPAAAAQVTYANAGCGKQGSSLVRSSSSGSEADISIEMKEADLKGTPGLRVIVVGMDISSSAEMQLEAMSAQQLMLTWQARPPRPAGRAENSTSSSMGHGHSTLDLPKPVDTRRARARFDSKRQRLVLDLPFEL